MRSTAFGIVLVVACVACSASGDGSGGGAGTRGGLTPVVPVGGASTQGGQGGNSPFDNAPADSVTDPQATGGSSGGAPAVDPNAPCEVAHLQTSPSTPDMLIVLDRSGSMGMEGRWQPSSDAVRSIVTSLQSEIRFGLALFPDPALTGSNGTTIDLSPCLNDPDPVACATNLLADAGVTDVNSSDGACAPGGIVVPVALDNAPAIGAQLDITQPNGGTPTGETLEDLVDEFTAPSVDPDMIQPLKYILLVTDGQPTCPNGRGRDTTQPDIDRSNAAIEELTARGAKTYVIGYNTTGPGNEMLASVLDGFAQRGGTGDTHHRPVEDEQSLLDEFQRIAGAAVSCSVALDEAPAQADHVLVRVDGFQVNLDDPDGWHLVGDRTIELTGKACDTLQADGEHQVDAEVHCEPVGPI